MTKIFHTHYFLSEMFENLPIHSEVENLSLFFGFRLDETFAKKAQMNFYPIQKNVKFIKRNV
jgi:hypothetical protein